MRRVLLVGCSGSGRTTVGAALAQRAGWPFLDDDALLARAAGQDVASLYAEGGREAVARAGATTLNLLLGIPGPLVGVVASEAVQDPAVRARLPEAGHVVWLRAELSTLQRRVGDGAGRPWLGDDPAATLGRFVAERYPHYRAIAHQVVDVDVVPVGQVARQVLEGLPEDLRPPA